MSHASRETLEAERDETEAERVEVLGLLHEARFVDLPPPQVWAQVLNAGQMFYSDNNEFNFDNDSASDAMIFETQLVASYKFSNGIKATVAPGWFIENAATLSGFVREHHGRVVHAVGDNLLAEFGSAVSRRAISRWTATAQCGGSRRPSRCRRTSPR